MSEKFSRNIEKNLNIFIRLKEEKDNFGLKTFFNAFFE